MTVNSGRTNAIGENGAIYNLDCSCLKTMKFGKNIGRVVELSDPEWSPFWINYKFLKKKVKALELSVDKLGTAPKLRSDPQAIARSAGEVDFYKMLRQELRKCSHFFTSVEAQFLVRQERLKEGWRQLLLPNIIVEGNPTKRLMAACVKLYKDLLLLENFAIMNYCGFSKILKKHDKLTGFRTRESFMRNVANHEPFVEHPKLIEMLSCMEQLFKDIENLPSARAEPGTRVPLREEQLFIDTMLTINTEAFRLQRQEGMDIGLNTSEFSHKRDGLGHTPAVVIAERVPTGMSSGLDMVAAAAQVVAKVREEEDEREGKAISVGAAAAATAAGASMAAALGPRHPVVERHKIGETNPAKRLCTSSR